MKKLLLVVCLGTALTVTLAPAGAWAQAPAATPAAQPLAFDVVSIKKSAPADSGNILSMVPMMQPSPTGLRAQNIALRLLIRSAYKLEDEQLIGGPDWQLSQKFDITAKIADAVPFTEDTLRARLQSLLTDQFKLKTHMETRELNASALVLANKDGKLGPNLKPSTVDCSNLADQAAAAAKIQQQVQSNPAGALAAMADMKCGIFPVPQLGTGGAPSIMIRGGGQPLSNMVQVLNQMLGRSVVDKTGLTGNYDFEFEMPLDAEMLRRAAGQAGVNLPIGANVPQYDGPSLGDILQQRLGLKLDSQKVPVQVMVIDSAEMPAAD
jgi:uncharacterized protein (TIGR03435 family)